MISPSPDDANGLQLKSCLKKRSSSSISLTSPSVTAMQAPQTPLSQSLGCAFPCVLLSPTSNPGLSSAADDSIAPFALESPSSNCFTTLSEEFTVFDLGAATSAEPNAKGDASRRVSGASEISAVSDGKLDEERNEMRRVSFGGEQVVIIAPRIGASSSNAPRSPLSRGPTGTGATPYGPQSAPSGNCPEQPPGIVPIAANSDVILFMDAGGHDYHNVPCMSGHHVWFPVVCGAMCLCAVSISLVVKAHRMRASSS